MPPSQSASSGPRHPKLTSKEKAKMRILHRYGFSRQRIADRVGRSFRSIGRVCNSMQFTLDAIQADYDEVDEKFRREFPPLPWSSQAGRGGPSKSRFKAKAKAKAKESDSLTNSSWDPSSDDEDDDESTTEEYCEADLTKRSPLSTGKVIIKTEAEDRPLRPPVPLPPLKSSSAVVRDNQALVGISSTIPGQIRVFRPTASLSTHGGSQVEPIDLTADTPPPPSATESISPKPAMASIKKPTLVRGVIVSRESIGGVPLAGVLARPGSSSDNSLSSQSKVHDLTDSTMPRASRPTSTSFPSPQISRTADHAPLSPPLPPLPDLKTFLKGTPNIDYDLSELHCALEAEGMGTIEQLFSFASWEEEELHTLFKTAIPDINVAQEFTMVRRLKMRAVELGRIPGAGPISTGDKS